MRDINDKVRLQVLEHSFISLCTIVEQILPPHLQEAVQQLSNNLEMTSMECQKDFMIQKIDG